MILGMTLPTFTLVHVVMSLVGIGSGLLVMYGLLIGKRLDGATAIFLASTVATSVTGFGFPFDHLLPSHKVGILSLLVLAVAIHSALCLSLGRSLAGDLRGLRCGCTLSQCVRPNGSVIREGAGPEGNGSDAERAAIPGRTTYSSRALRRAYSYCSEEVPDRTGQRGLMEAVSCSPHAATCATRISPPVALPRPHLLRAAWVL